MDKSNSKKENLSKEGKKEETMEDILKELNQKMEELEELKKRVENENFKKISAQKTKEMLEEIIVPPLELIREPKKKKSETNGSSE